MIVKCEQCQTRFKIPDDKVTDKGVKVRCTKCGNTFRVTRDMAQPATGQLPAAAPPPPVGPPSKEADPFARFGTAAEPNMGDPTRPGVFALGVEATRVPERAAPAAPPASTGFDFSSLVPPPPAATSNRGASAAPAPFDFSAIAPPPPASGPAAGGGFDFSALAAPPAPATSGQAFDFSGLTAPPPPAAPAPRAPPAPAASTPAFDFSALGAPPEAPPQPQPSPRAGPSASVPQPAFDFALPPASPSKPQSSTPLSFDAAGDELGQVPLGGAGSPPRTDEFFNSPMPTQGSRPLLDLPDDISEADAKRALFEIPEPAAAPAPEPSFVTAAPAAPAPPMQPPVLAGPAQGKATPERRSRSALGVLVNVVIAAVLVVALVLIGSALLNDGKVTSESLSLEHLKATFIPESDFSAADISNGLYETRSGRSVFFVRGEVINRGATATRVVVQADIVEGAKVVRSAHSLAGAVPTPEELYTLGVGDELEKKLEAQVAPRALQLEPGAAAPFLVVFTEYPPDLKGFRVRVVARPEGGTTAQRP